MSMYVCAFLCMYTHAMELRRRAFTSSSKAASGAEGTGVAIATAGTASESTRSLRRRGGEGRGPRLQFGTQASRGRQSCWRQLPAHGVGPNAHGSHASAQRMEHLHRCSCTIHTRRAAHEGSKPPHCAGPKPLPLPLQDTMPTLYTRLSVRYRC
jgi:hypothetical protein